MSLVRYWKISLIYIMSITRDIIFNRISQHADMDGNWTYRHRLDLPLIASNFMELSPAIIIAPSITTLPNHANTV